MLDIILKILSVLGIILLVLLAILLVAVLLILFFPITYKIFGKKKAEEMQAYVKANWLFGLLRVRFFYPDPGNIIVKILWFTVFDSSKTAKEEKAKEEASDANSDEKTSGKKSASEKNSSQENSAKSTPTSNDTNSQIEKLELSEVDGIQTEDTKETSQNSGNEQANPAKQTLSERILAKYEKIKCTILKIYDKIKDIAENIAFYKALFQDEQTVGLLNHALSRLGHILKSIRPRKLKGEILLGTGSPDTAGYAYGIYGMASAWLGNGICVTPDFTQAILEGEIYGAGHITVFKLLWHSLRVVLDKRLQLLIHRIKTHKI